MDEQIPISLERVEQPFGLVLMTERGSEAWLGLAFDEPPDAGPGGRRGAWQRVGRGWIWQARRFSSRG